MIADLFADVTLRECIAAALGFSLGLVVMVLSGFAVDFLARRNERQEDDQVYQFPFADSDPVRGEHEPFGKRP